jgi:hypothetical protein
MARQRASAAFAGEIYTKPRASDNRVNPVATCCDEPPHAAQAAITPFAPDGIGPY